MSDDVHELQSQVERLTKENDAKARIIEKLKTVMVAAAEEIQEHWAAHCDDEGYGPSNLMHRLKAGLAADYCGYRPGAFLGLANELKAATEEHDRYKVEMAALLNYLRGVVGYYVGHELAEMSAPKAMPDINRAINEHQAIQRINAALK